MSTPTASAIDVGDGSRLVTSVITESLTPNLATFLGQVMEKVGRPNHFGQNQAA
jgi:hypothetical protein